MQRNRPTDTEMRGQTSARAVRAHPCGAPGSSHYPARGRGAGGFDPDWAEREIIDDILSRRVI